MRFLASVLTLIYNLTIGLASLLYVLRQVVQKRYLDQKKNLLLFEKLDSNVNPMSDESSLEHCLKQANYAYEIVRDEEEFLRKLKSTEYDIVAVDYYCEYSEPILQAGEQKDRIKYINIKLEQLDQLIEEIRLDMKDVWCRDGHHLAIKAQSILDSKPDHLRAELAIYSRYARKLTTTEEFNELQELGISWLWKHKEAPSSITGDAATNARQRELNHLNRLAHTSKQRKFNASWRLAALTMFVASVLAGLVTIFYQNSSDLNTSVAVYIPGLLVGIIASVLVNALSFIVKSGNK